MTRANSAAQDRVTRKPNMPHTARIAGENACPPEDVGGAPRYAEFLEILNDSTHEEHDNMIRWAGGSFEPALFDIRRQ